MNQTNFLSFVDFEANSNAIYSSRIKLLFEGRIIIIDLKAVKIRIAPLIFELNNEPKRNLKINLKKKINILEYSLFLVYLYT